ncbi:EAL domain-containing protein [Roseobacter sp.]|uniref:EAL domain-containing protein n=1 Tax=Roseobacter sp. TaxID=1907202 RepID=UPI00385FA0B8
MASDWFWETDSEHRFCYFSRRMEEVTKFDISALLGKKRDIIPNENLSDPKWIKHRDDLKNHRPFRNFEYEMRRPHDGTLLWIRIAGEPQFDESGRFTGYRGTGHDITQEKVAMQRLEESNAALAARNNELDQAKKLIEKTAYEDPLTNLFNRRAFERDMKQELSDDRRGLGLLHVDLDRFKWVNDTLGHPAGDHVLKVSAQRLKDTVGENGTVYRVGGDEFMVILRRNPTVDLSTCLGDTIVSAMAEPFHLVTHQVTVGASVGIVIAEAGEFDAGQLVNHADAALYEAKRSGRNESCLSTPKLQARIDDERRLSRDIPGALERREFVPFFQPQIDVVSGMVCGAEALVRWKHPERGLLQPIAFLRTAIELGRIDQIDRLILQTSTEVIDRFECRGIALPSLSINVSEARLADPNLCKEIESLWHGRRCQLAIELLETIYFDESSGVDQFSDSLRRLREMGVRIETDDFGSGRASITGLLRISPDRVKIDRTLIQKVVGSRKQRSLVKGIIDMCHALDIDCIAEGVETQADVDAIVELGCRKFQGFAFSAPLSEDDFERYLTGQKIAPQLMLKNNIAPHKGSFANGSH